MPHSTNDLEPNDVQIAIVGMGPRGTSTLERLCASASEFITEGAKLKIHVIDPFKPGPGAVWRSQQSSELLMNTVTSQVTLFTDKSVICEGPIQPGPTLYRWATVAAPELGPDDYPNRAQYGRYLEWVFNEILRRAPSGVEVEVHTARAICLDDESDGRQELTLSDGVTLSGLAGVVLAQGHLPLVADPKQQQLAAYAERNGLRHLQPANPADVDLSQIAAGEIVLLRGLGLNFFDYVALLTTGRGGVFVDKPEGLLYKPSGKEPRLYAGCRRGIPHQARGDNMKGAYGRHTPLVFTEEVINGFRDRANAGDTPDFMKEVWPLVAKEVETVYYEALLGGHQQSPPCDEAKRREIDSFRKRFLDTPHGSPQEAELLDEFGISEANRWSWDRISRPWAGQTFATAEVWHDWLVEYLRNDAKQARMGNYEGPQKAALDVMRDLRNELRLIVDHRGVSGESYRDHLDGWYTPLNAYLSIGPPRQRIEQMVALMEAGVLSVVGPEVELLFKEGGWLARSPEVPGSNVRATTLIEARLPEPSLRNTADELLAYLLNSGQCRPHMINGVETAGLDVTEPPYNLIDRRGKSHIRRFALGVPTEGVHWVTAAGARPGVNSVTLTDTDAVARAMLHMALPKLEKQQG